MFPGVTIPGLDLINPWFASRSNYLDWRARVNIPTSWKHPTLSRIKSKVQGREEKQPTEIPNNVPKMEPGKGPSE